MFKTLQFIGVVAAMSLGVVVSVKTTAGSVSEPGGQGMTTCDVNLLYTMCPPITQGNFCDQPMDLPGPYNMDKKLASDQTGTDNCKNYFDNIGIRCTDIQQVRVLQGLSCAVAPPM